MFEKNNPTVALNVLYIKEMEICPAYVSKISSNCEKQIRVTLTCSKKTIYVIERNKLKK